MINTIPEASTEVVMLTGYKAFNTEQVCSVNVTPILNLYRDYTQGL